MSEEKKVCTFFRKRKGAAVRKRKSSSEDSDTDNTAVVKKDQKTNFNPLVQGTTKRRRQRHFTDSGGSDEEETAGVSHLAFKSNRDSTRQGPSDMGATATIETLTEKDKDAVAIAERALQLQSEKTEDGEAASTSENPVYKGINNYTGSDAKFRGNKYSARGPNRAPENVRVTVRWDYAPDVCKDYKETGFCGFGDSCIFLHDRGDYKHGWQLENDERNCGGDDDDRCYEISSDEDDLPFKCIICRRSFVNPVVTKCKHYFCEKCALARYRQTARCYVCNVDTRGTFNPAKDLERKLKEGGIQEEEEEEDQVEAEEREREDGVISSLPTVDKSDDDDDDDSDSD